MIKWIGNFLLANISFWLVLSAVYWAYVGIEMFFKWLQPSEMTQVFMIVGVFVAIFSAVFACEETDLESRRNVEKK